MKTLLNLTLAAAVSLVVWGAALPAQAASPTVSVVREGSGDNYRVTVMGDQYGYINELAYRTSGSSLWTRITGLGSLDSSGYYTTILSFTGSSAGEMYATVNGQQSGTVQVSGNSNCQWGYCGNVGGITLSQTSVSLNVGQAVSVTASIPYLANLYVSNNSNPSVVSAWVSGSIVYLRGESSGSANVTVCAGSSCGTVYVSVAGTGYGSISFSQTNMSLNQNQSVTVYIYNTSGSSGSYYVSNNSNASVVDVSISGNSMSFYGRSSGSSTVTVCQYSGSCGTVYVSVSGYGSGSFSLSPSSLTVNQGQTGTVYASFSTPLPGYLYIASNSSSNIAQATISGNSVSVYGSNPGSTTLSVCYSALSQCQNVYVTVQGGGYGGSLNLLTTSLPQMYAGQYYSTQFFASGGSSPYTYSVQSGSLPAGMSLSSSGQLFGTPQNTASAMFLIRVSDSYGRYSTQWFSLAPVCQNWSGSGCVLGGSTYSNGQLINENGTVYIVYKNTKSAFSSRQAFEGFGFSFSNVVNAGSPGISNTGYVIATSQTSHPWGSWVRSGQTVYFVHESGLIPIPSYQMFQNNGGQDRLVVPVNSWDFRLPILSLMVDNDPRLR